MAPLQVALDKGEFKKEGLNVDLKVLPTPDALPLPAKGGVDALWAAPEAAVMNGTKGGFDIKWVAGNFSPDPKSKSGLWAPLKAGESASRVARADRRLGTMIGKGSVIAYPVERALERHGGGLADIQYQQLGSADVLTALRNGDVDSAWLLDPVWRTPPLHMDWEIRSGTTTRLQSTYDAQDAAEGSPLPESRTVNRTPYEEAVGPVP